MVVLTSLEEDSKKEPAWEAVDSNNPGIYIWRVKNLKLEVVPQDDHGTFFDGDTYIVLHSYMVSRNLKHNVFLWIGRESSQDEYGVGAYKMVELDYHKLKDSAVQHREVQGCESEKFLELFGTFTILHGGYQSGFRKSKKEEKPYIFHISGVKKNVRIQTVPFCQESIHSDDVYIIDLCGHIYMFKGKSSNKEEQFFATQCWSQFKSKKPTSKFEIIDESSDGRPLELFSKIPSAGSSSDPIQQCKAQTNKVSKENYVLLKVSDQSGQLEQTVVAKGNQKLDLLKSDDIFILNAKNKLYIWVGSKASQSEQRSAMMIAGKYAELEKMMLCPVDVEKEGAESDQFLACF